MKILLLNGSIAKKSHTKGLLRYTEKLLHDKGVETIFWDLSEPDKKIPDVRPEYHRDPMKHPEEIVRTFASTIDEADGYVLGSPLYHGSYSGVLKNALDNLRSDPFRDKWVGIVGNGSGPRADALQLAHLRTVVKNMYGYDLQTKVGTGGSDYTDTGEGFELTDESIQQRCERMVDELIRNTKAFSSI